MKVTFLLPTVRLSGGVKVVFEYANRLQARGHDVSIAYPILPLSVGKQLFDIRYLKKYLYGVIGLFLRRDSVDWFDVKVNLMRVPNFSEKNIPDSDVIIATWWQTSYHVAKYRKNKGEKFYLIQHYETWGGPTTAVENSYQLGLHNIAISTWLKRVIEELGAPVAELILNGLDFDEFYPEDRAKNNEQIRILIPYRREKWKGVNDGLKVFEIVKDNCPKARLVMFGPKARKQEIPEDVEFHSLPTRDKLRKVYNSCDIFCFPSHSEGFGLPPFEAMACRLPVVATNVGAMSDCAIDGETALITEPKDIQSMAENIVSLINNPRMREEIAEAGHQYVKKFTWERAVDKMEKTLQRNL
jgi:glycosyltransferase involved in cell wall biosynthesis